MLTESSKYLAYLLRHRPEVAGLSIDSQGWVTLEQLIANTSLFLDEVLEIVRTDAKGRYALSPDGKRIRAVQGHSTPKVQLKYDRVPPPDKLFHGTTDLAWELIQKEGLRPMNRQYVHLTEDLDEAAIVGGRRKRDLVLLEITTSGMKQPFFRAENGVWLVANVEPKHLQRI